jgi:multiple sugar transport system permease protein
MPRARSIKRQELQLHVLLRVLFAITAFVFLFPLIWALSLSLKDISQLFSFPPRIIPLRPTLDAYVFVLTRTRIPLYLWNSVKIVSGMVVLTLAVSVPAAYCLSRFRFRLRELVQFAILVFHMVSLMVIAVPLYRYFSALGLLNSHAGVILMYTAWQAPLVTWIVRGFMESIPKELDDAAMIDGCSRLETLVRIIAPTAAPGIVSASILMAVAAWAQFIVPFVMLDDQRLYPISIGIMSFESTQEAIQTHLIAAASMISILPVLVIFVVLQKFIVRALTAGAVKG